MENTELKEALEHAYSEVQRYTDKIQDAINPIPNMSLPFLYVALQTFMQSVEMNMDAEQKVIAKGLPSFLGTEQVVTTMTRDMYEASMKNNAGGDR